MKTFKLALTISLALCSANSQAEEFRIDRLFVLGDSLSDGGTYTGTATQGLLGAGVPAGAIPDRMKFTTNSPTAQIWANIVAGKLGIPLDVDVINGVSTTINGGNYAQGGSRVSNPMGIANNPAIGITTIPVTQQVDRLLADTPTFNRNDLIALWAGSNDGFIQFATVAAGAITPSTALAEMSIAATALLTQIDRLKAAGAQNIVVVTVPNLGATPQAQIIEDGSVSGTPAPGSIALLNALSASFNNTLASAAASKGAVIVDSNRLLNAVIANPARYGFTSATPLQPACGDNGSNDPNTFFNSSLTCIQGVNAAADSEQRIFADGVHPTAAAQRLFGEAGFAGLQAASLNGALAVAPLTPIRQHALGLENRLTALALVREDATGKATLRPVGDTEWYGGVEAGQFELDAQQVQAGLEADTQIVKFGGDRMITRNALLGFGISIDKAQTDIANNGGGFDNDIVLGTVFSTIALSKSLYLNAALALGKIDYDVTRQFTLGPSTERYTASTEGDFSSARVGLGSIHGLPQGWTLNPQAAYTVEKIDLQGYDESSGAASLSFGDTQYKAERISLGFLVTKAPSVHGGWRPLLRYSIESDQNDDDLKIRMGPNQNTLATILAPRPDGDFQLLSVGVVKEIDTGVLNIHLTSTLGQSGVKGLGLGAAYKAVF
ncbi:autotransporter domain-containing protein [Limnobacter sp.]|uniref:autotransporter domain-containing protein n=1 Tax=Limnobacter sp. TaxID=2003368 RepID=UPI0027335011|nr:autotransporter domain-containing protein [Limnobacter sp.]MDP3186990.1 autotransporter domain-containing protein [Limnobacter sp.]